MSRGSQLEVGNANAQVELFKIIPIPGQTVGDFIDAIQGKYRQLKQYNNGFVSVRAHVFSHLHKYFPEKIFEADWLSKPESKFWTDLDLMVGLAIFQPPASSLNIDAINVIPSSYNNNQQSYDRSNNQQSSYNRNRNYKLKTFYPKPFDKPRFDKPPYRNDQIYYQNTSNSSIKYNPRGYNPFNNNKQKGKPPYRPYRKRGYVWNKGKRSQQIYELSIDPET